MLLLETDDHICNKLTFKLLISDINRFCFLHNSQLVKLLQDNTKTTCLQICHTCIIINIFFNYQNAWVYVPVKCMKQINKHMLA